ncbi:MAG TPA: cytochrome c [Terriglobales bacterium]|nr:cytochrome c [Terriglobales bacterium]
MNSKMLIALTALVLSLCTVTWAAEDGQALYKAKCASCHGANGEGKPSMKAPPIKGSSLTSKLPDHITKGDSKMKPPHNKGIPGVTEEQAKAIAEYVKTLN